MLVQTMNAPRRRSWGAWLGGVLVILLLALTLLGPWLAPYDPTAVDVSQRLQGMSEAHWLGTDHLGRDVLSRLITGARLSLGTVVLTLCLILTLGIVVGGVAGFIGGRLDTVLMRVGELFMTVPTFVLALFFIGVLGTGLSNVILAIALSHWAWYARMVRSLVISLRGRDYLLASRLAGASRLQSFVSHILPSVLGQLMVLASLDIGHMMLHVSGLSFLGLGVSPPTPEWGVMINDAKEFLWTHPQLLLWPGLMIFLTVMAFNLLGDALRDRLDPSLRTGGH
ncbi:nickel ABC transporter permease subunit NikC [Pseudomonas sp. LTJR-52]|uniref:nickel ABC transporter permease subunit NikC n=1 Tax=Pseudomonas sp. LTJR-52 TaxID=2479392 RepID=UPI000EFC0081|nr:nickel ABC transporter permease subunit NikC [Pseudomonas sp. LTJR-52]AYN93009.1 nickel ABC transporter permease subunit NikC [Pseudomonas sp. LTJR-52]